MAQGSDFDAQDIASGQRMHFIVGMPRSGSTLLAALLGQNPRFYASGPSPAQAIFSSLYTGMSGDSEMSAMLSDDQRASVLKAVVEGVHAPKKGEAPVLFDSNRRWLTRVDQLARLYPLCRFVICVRNPASVINSLERTRQNVAFRQSRLFHPNETLRERIERLMAPDGMVGSTLNLVSDALMGIHAERMLLLEYEYLLKSPGKSMQLLYKFIREPEFEHDFENFYFDMQAFDNYLNSPGLHSISGPLRPESSTDLLPPQMRAQLSEKAFWKSCRSQAVMLLDHSSA